MTGRALPLLLLTGAIACFWEAQEDRWVAQVDGTEIPFAELQRVVDERIEESPELRREDVLSEELNRLVSERVILNRARELGVKIHDAEVMRRLVGIHGEDFSADTAYFEEVRRQMTLDRMVLLDLAGRLTLPESTLLLYFEEHRERYRRPAQVEIRQIVAEDESTAQSLRQQLVDGADFPALAAEHSLAPEAGDGGLLPPFAQGELPEVFDRAFRLRPRELSEVIESPYGFHIFRLESRFAQHEPEFREVRDEIALELQQQRLKELRRDWLRELRRRAEVKVNEPLLDELR